MRMLRDTLGCKWARYIFKEEIEPGEALGGASGAVCPPCVQGKLLAMIRGEVWELILVNQRTDTDFAAHLAAWQGSPCTAEGLQAEEGQQKITL